jgi:hypothetical protein
MMREAALVSAKIDDHGQGAAPKEATKRDDGPINGVLFTLDEGGMLCGMFVCCCQKKSTRQRGVGVAAAEVWGSRLRSLGHPEPPAT